MLCNFHIGYVMPNGLNAAFIASVHPLLSLPPVPLSKQTGQRLQMLPPSFFASPSPPSPSPPPIPPVLLSSLFSSFSTCNTYGSYLPVCCTWMVSLQYETACEWSASTVTYIPFGIWDTQICNEEKHKEGNHESNYEGAVLVPPQEELFWFEI